MTPATSGVCVYYCRTYQSINLLLFLQKQNLATAIYLFGLGTLLTGLGLKHMREYYVSYLSTPLGVHYYK